MIREITDEQMINLKHAKVANDRVFSIV